MTTKIQIKNAQEVKRMSLATIDKNDLFLAHKEHGIFCLNHTRLIIFTLSTVCLSLVVGNSLALNFTVICMLKPGEHYRDANGTINKDAKTLYSSHETSLLFSAVAIGTIIGTLPISYFSNRFGIRNTFTVYGILSAASTLLLPWTVEWGFAFVFLMRAVQGFSVATSYPSMGSIVAEWSTVKRMGLYVAWLSIHLQLSSIFTMPVSAAFCGSTYGWKGVYYLQGGLTLVFFILFFAYYRDLAADHPNVSSKELTILQKEKFVRVLEKGERMPVPYKEIFTDWAVIGCIVSCFSSNMGFNVFIQYGPTFLHKVLEFDVSHTGFAAALPSIICIAVKFTMGPCSDHLPYLSSKGRVILFATVSQFCMAGCFISLAFLPPGHPKVAQSLFTGAIVFSGLNAVGVIKSCHLISGRFAYIIMALHQFTNSLIILILPGLVALLAPDNTRAQWARILISISVLVVVAIIFFDFTCEGTSRKWAIETAPHETTVNPIDIAASDLKDLGIVERALAEKHNADLDTQPVTQENNDQLVDVRI